MLRAETQFNQEIVLDDLIPEDANVMAEWAADAAPMDALAVGDEEPVRAQASVENEADRIAAFASDPDCIVWAIRADARLVGQVWIDTNGLKTVS